MPILEEAIFRLPLVKKTKHFFISATLLILFAIYIDPPFLGYLAMSVYAVTLILYYYTRIVNLKLLISSSLCCFALVHYPSIQEIAIGLKGGYIFFQLFLGLMTTYLVLKYSIKHSILLHVTYNLLLILSMFYFSYSIAQEESMDLVEQNGHVITIEPLGIYSNSPVSVVATSQEFSCTNCFPNELLNFKNRIDGDIIKKVPNEHQFIKFNIDVRPVKKEDTVNYKWAVNFLNDKLIRTIDK